jgi:hypothetical protein
MTRDHMLVNPARRIALGLAGVLIAVTGLIAAQGASAAAPKGCPAKLACQHGEPTKLWYRVTMFFVGKDTRTLDNGVKFESNASWRLDSQHAVLLKRICYRPATRRRAAKTTAGPCPSGPGTRRLIDDVSFAAGAEGLMYKNESTETFPYPDFATNFNGKDGRVHCEEDAILSVKLNGQPEVTGFISTEAGSQGLGYALSMPQSPDDATERDPLNPVHCTFEEYDPLTQTYTNPQPYTVPAGTPAPSYLTDLARGSTTGYERGTEWSGQLDFHFSPGRFGHEYLQTWHVKRPEDDRPPLPPVEFDDTVKLLLHPCPKHGRDVNSC